MCVVVYDHAAGLSGPDCVLSAHLSFGGNCRGDWAPGMAGDFMQVPAAGWLFAARAGGGEGGCPGLSRTAGAYQ